MYAMFCAVFVQKIRKPVGGAAVVAGGGFVTPGPDVETVVAGGGGFLKRAYHYALIKEVK